MRGERYRGGELSSTESSQVSRNNFSNCLVSSNHWILHVLRFLARWENAGSQNLKTTFNRVGSAFAWLAGVSTLSAAA